MSSLDTQCNVVFYNFMFLMLTAVVTCHHMSSTSSRGHIKMFFCLFKSSLYLISESSIL